MRRSFLPLLPLLALLGCLAEPASDTSSPADTSSPGDTSVGDSARGDDTATDACVPSITVTPTAVDFGDVHGDEGPSETVAVTNTGCDDLQILGVELAATTDPAFSLTAVPPAGSLVAPGDATLVEVACVPTAVGLVTGSVSVYSDAAATPLVEVTLACTGAD